MYRHQAKVTEIRSGKRSYLSLKQEYIDQSHQIIRRNVNSASSLNFRRAEE